MSQINKVNPLQGMFLISWPTVLSLSTAFIATGTIALHLIGHISHSQYLRHWEIDSSLFPKTTDWILINGYYATVDRFLAILKTISGNIHGYAVAAVILGLYVFFLLLPVGKRRNKTPEWFLRQPIWLQRLVQQMLLTGLVVGVLPCALFLLTAFMIIPVAFGETAGKAVAESRALEYKKSCQASKIPCVQLQKEGQIIVTGFVLDSSPSHIAIIHACTQHTHILPMDKLEIISRGIAQPKCISKR